MILKDYVKIFVFFSVFKTFTSRIYLATMLIYLLKQVIWWAKLH